MRIFRLHSAPRRFDQKVKNQLKDTTSMPSDALWASLQKRIEAECTPVSERIPVRGLGRQRPYAYAIAACALLVSIFAIAAIQYQFQALPSPLVQVQEQTTRWGFGPLAWNKPAPEDEATEVITSVPEVNGMVQDYQWTTNIMAFVGEQTPESNSDNWQQFLPKAQQMPLPQMISEQAIIKAEDHAHWSDNFEASAKAGFLNRWTRNESEAPATVNSEENVAAIAQDPSTNNNFSDAVGFNVGLALGYRLGKHFVIQSELMHAQYQMARIHLEASNAEVLRFNAKYLQLPVLLKYQLPRFGLKGKRKQFSINYLIGLQYGYLTGANREFENHSEQLDLSEVKNHELGMIAGMEYDWHFTPKFRFSVGARTNVGTTASLIPQLAKDPSFRPYNIGYGLTASLKFTPGAKNQ